MLTTSAIQSGGSPATSSRPIDSRSSAWVVGRKAIPSSNARWRGVAPRAASSLASGLPLQAYRHSVHRLVRTLTIEYLSQYLRTQLICLVLCESSMLKLTSQTLKPVSEEFSLSDNSVTSAARRVRSQLACLMCLAMQRSMTLIQCITNGNTQCALKAVVIGDVHDWDWQQVHCFDAELRID